ncbi:hypothetical protein SAMN02910298_02578 [Pseudobutyrivibrio sp. YE44]|uniref:hypothetical protein n=1 Tax=Pseudobutyrivibrio sp. YE44 TaxID=1520802 RepID=UPI0008919D98|nr:hypothetical protein [Pseudobutyrivibrio sp. YE44]SDB50696.1 hypothetical protein SAMN02910298_02578 [Pseudobutyrivibrio sp. YE44]
MLKQIGKEKLILIGVGVLALIVIAVLLITDQATPKTYYDEGYPVKSKELKDGGLKITVDGSKSADVPWEYQELEDSPIEYKVKASSDAKLTITIAPVKSGYETIKLTKVRRINELDYPVATLYLDVVVAAGEKGFVAKLVQVDERVSEGILGAEDTDEPYYIKENYVYLPNGGEWSLYNAAFEGKEVPEDDYTVTPGMDDNGSHYYRVNHLADQEQLELVLKNETLQQEIKLVAVSDDNGNITIKKAAAK